MDGHTMENEDHDAERKSLQRRLTNYKQQHAGTAVQKKVSIEFAAARTLTQARKVLWGIKTKMKKS